MTTLYEQYRVETGTMISFLVFPRSVFTEILAIEIGPDETLM